MTKIKVPPLDEVMRRDAEGSYRAYLNGSMSRNWVIGKIRENGVRGIALLSVLDKVDSQMGLDETTKPRSQDLRKELSRLGWI